MPRQSESTPRTEGGPASSASPRSRVGRHPGSTEP
jgi:hypothetical protein